MIPNIRGGRSFRGAGLYYLHDKASEGIPNPATANRVLWTTTRNCANTEPALALEEMRRTAADQELLKQASGIAGGGRKTEDPVKTISLSWAPHQRPSRDEMQEAADSYLKAMGWHEHEAVFIAHGDTAHPHLHIILNRIHPETGRTLNDWQDRKRSQKWATEYEREHGQILCKARAAKHDLGQRPIGPDLQTDGQPYPYARLFQESQRAFESAQEAHAALVQLDRELLCQQHRCEREAHLDAAGPQFRKARNNTWKSVRAEFKPAWREHFAEAKRRRTELGLDLAEMNNDAALAMRERRFDDALDLWQQMYDWQQTVEKSIAADARLLHAEQKRVTKERLDEACKALLSERNSAFDTIKARQAGERLQLKEWQIMRDAGPIDQDQPVQPIAAEPIILPPMTAAEQINDLLTRADPTSASGQVAPDQSPPISVLELSGQLVPDSTKPEPLVLEGFDHLLADANHDRVNEAGRGDAEDRDLAAPATDLNSAASGERPPAKDLADAGAGVIGAIADGIAKLIGDFFSPPTPQEQAEARRQSEREEEQRPQQEEAAFQAHLEKLARQAADTLTADKEAKEIRHERDWEDRQRSRER